MKNRAALGNETDSSLELEWTKKVWGSPCLPKIKLFMWKLVQGALALGANLEKRGCGSVLCPRCGEKETVEHLILHCRFVREVWMEAPFLRMVAFDQFTSLKEALAAGIKLHCIPPSRVTSPVFLWICWSLWTARNKIIFENKALTPSEVIHTAIRSAREWNLAQPMLTSTTTSTDSYTRSAVPAHIRSHDCVSIFTDAAWRPTDGVTGCGWILKDPILNATQHGSRCFDYTPSALVGEGLAVRLALSHALSSGFSKVCVFSDCQVLIRALSSKSPPVELYGIARDIDILSSLFESFSLSFISISLNSEADLLAKAAICNVAFST
ncbi:hypothetical protein Bca4012_048000 [Brassica carinata]